MLRRIGTLAAAAFVATPLVAVIPASPASASTDVCAGAGTLTTGALYYPGFPRLTTTPNTVGYALTLEVGICTPSLATTLNAAGFLTGWCGNWTGRGTAEGHHTYSHISVGSFDMIAPVPSPILPPTAVAFWNVAPDATAGQSCVTGATKFLVSGLIVLI